MASISLSPAPSLIDIRFGKTDVVVVALAPSTQSDLLEQLKKRLGKASAIYQNEPLVIDLAQWQASELKDNPLALQAIKQITDTAGMNLIEVRSHLDEFEEACENLGIRHTEPKAEAKQEAAQGESPKASTNAASDPQSPATKVVDQTGTTGPDGQQTELDLASDQTTSQSAEQATEQTEANEAPVQPKESSETAQPATARKSMIVNNPVRSGQRIYAQGADLVVMGQVSAGAEVIADGNVHVYGVLRGRALAGAAGDTEARILSTCFEAELVSIAGYYLTFEAGHPSDVRSQPTLIQLDDGEPQKSVRIKPINIR